MNQIIFRIIASSRGQLNIWEQSTNALGLSYIKSYPHLLAFFDENLLIEKTLIQGAHLIYGWMPKPLNICKSDIPIQKVITSIISLGKDKNMDFYDLENVKLFMNNSLVGASKLLHFIYPEKFPIWDSKICGKIVAGNVAYQVEQLHNYIEYKWTLGELKNHPSCLNFIIQFENKFHYRISKLRAAELIIFTSYNNHE